MLGLDLLGLGSPYWKIGDILETVPKDFLIGVFDGSWPNAFGNPVPKLRKLIGRGYRFFRVQLWYEKSHALIPMDILIKRLKVYQGLKDAFPDTTIYISPTCEIRSTNEGEIRKRLNKVHDLAPGCVPVYSPEGNGVLLPDYIIEHHGDSTGQAVSLDGTDIKDIDSKKWLTKNKAAIYRLGWTGALNLNRKGEYPNGAPPPNLRNKPPTLQEFKYLVQQMRG